MKKRRKVSQWCPTCDSLMVRYNPSNVDHVLARAPGPEWRCLLNSPDLLVLACVAVQTGDAPALAATLQLAGMRLRVRRAA